MRSVIRRRMGVEAAATCDMIAVRIYLVQSESTTQAMRARIADGEARDRLIIWIRRRMEEFGITVDALAISIQHDVDHPPLYRDARGNEWNGLGDMPDWPRAAKNAGVNSDFFRIEKKPDAMTPGGTPSAPRQQSDRRQLDLFNAP